MNDSSQQPERHPDRRPVFHRPPADLEVLRAHPSLAPLASRGWQLDRLPMTSTVWAFGGAVLVSMLALGAAGGVFVVLALACAVALAASALRHRDVAAARAVLHIARAALLTWIVIAALFLRPSWADEGTARDAGPQVSPRPSSSAPAAVRPAPTVGRGGGSGKAGAQLTLGTP